MLPSLSQWQRALSAQRVPATPRAASLIAPDPRRHPLEYLAQLLVGGRLVLLDVRVAPVPIAPVLDRPPVAPPEPVLETVTRLAWIRFKVVHHATGEPFVGVRLVVRSPSGFESAHRTREGGLVEIHDIDPGQCDVWSPLKGARLARTLDFVEMGDQPSNPTAQEHVERVEPPTPLSTEPARAEWIAEVREHHVQTGESLESIATANDFSWQELAEFNWDTREPDRINEHLRDDVGCTQKTSDGFNYRFSSEDEPGLLYIPRPWSASGLATEQTHVIRARALGGLRCWIRLDVDPANVEVFDDRFVLLGVDDGYRVEKMVKDDQIPGDHYVDLRYSGLKAGGRYSLQVFDSQESQPHFVFENVSYQKLAGLSPAAGEAGDDDESEWSPGEDEPYPEDSDVDEEELADVTRESVAD